ncbi:hypothetical protein FPQ18DRAFT_325474 [Pyronema domesticum]|uniref:Uncharacterized protein n=1 Tax=Pyronema omphalodes (strain CBS 100304) TaxID=1076935 RepID=U4LCT6_PYROM|nr:hypothetical protein FPQ18DRAFT_325474 [Pyronema domesticum]CCX29688.1 Protein of unknown function [Pyronema omphalodes CBS 100304]
MLQFPICLVANLVLTPTKASAVALPWQSVDNYDAATYPTGEGKNWGAGYAPPNPTGLAVGVGLIGGLSIVAIIAFVILWYRHRHELKEMEESYAENQKRPKGSPDLSNGEAGWGSNPTSPVISPITNFKNPVVVESMPASPEPIMNADPRYMENTRRSIIKESLQRKPVPSEIQYTAMPEPAMRQDRSLVV